MLFLGRRWKCQLQSNGAYLELAFSVERHTSAFKKFDYIVSSILAWKFMSVWLMCLSDRGNYHLHRTFLNSIKTILIPV